MQLFLLYIFKTRAREIEKVTQPNFTLVIHIILCICIHNIIYVNVYEFDYNIHSLQFVINAARIKGGNGVIKYLIIDFFKGNA